MIKKIFFLLFAVTFCTSANAQTASRVIAFAKFGADTTRPCADSGGYKYSGGRGGEIQSGSAHSDEDYPFVIIPTYDFETGFTGIVKCDSSWEQSPTDTDISTQVFDTNNNIVSANCHKLSNGIWQNYNTYSYSYDANNNLLLQSYLYSSNGNTIPGENDIYTYDSLDRITSQTIQFWGTTKYYIYYQEYYAYDNENNPILMFDALDTSKVHYLNSLYFHSKEIPDSIIMYRYSSNGFPSGIGLSVYYFSPNNDTMILDPITDYKTTINTYDKNHYKTCTIRIMHKNYPDTSIDWLSCTRTDWSYNADNQVTCERYYNYDSTGNLVFTGLVRFYYETYQTEVPFSVNNMQVFPSPAHNAITIKIEWGSAQPFTMAIFDAAGRLAMRWDEPATQKYEKTIYLPFLAPGNYFIRATAGKQKLVKQIVLVN